MNSGLVSKELRDLRPFIALGFLLLLLEVGDWLLEGFNTVSLRESFSFVDTDLGAVVFLLAFAAGTGVLIREVDDRTLTFLDGLPVTRLQVFGIKFVTTTGVLLLYPLGHVLLMLVQHLLSRGLLDHDLHPLLLAQAFTLSILVTAVGLSLGMLLGFLRSLCWLVIALLALAIILIKLQWPAIAVLNPVELLRPQLVGVHWQVSGAALAVQFAMLAGCLLLSLRIFLKGGVGEGSSLRTQLLRPVISAIVTLATIGVCIGAALVFAVAQDKQERSTKVAGQAPGTEFAVSPAGSSRTDFYSFSYPAQSSSRAQDLRNEADELYLAVARLLEAPRGARIDVDLSGSVQNTEGVASYDRIRMRPGPFARITLAHETAHVLAHRLAGGEQDRELPKMKGLNEGLAEWIGNAVGGEGALTLQTRLVAAIVSQRRLVKVEQMMDPEALSRVADQTLVYPLGAAVVDVTIKRYGQGALHKLLTAIGNPDFPRGLHGPELWHATYQAAGFDLALVMDDYARQVKSWETEFAQYIAELPRPRGSLVTRNGRVGVELRFDRALPQGWTGITRFRPNQSSEIYEYSGARADEQGIAWTPRTRVAGKDVCFQPGVVLLDQRGTAIFESWVCLPRSSAVELKQ